MGIIRCGLRLWPYKGQLDKYFFACIQKANSCLFFICKNFKLGLLDQAAAYVCRKYTHTTEIYSVGVYHVTCDHDVCNGAEIFGSFKMLILASPLVFVAKF